MHDSAEHIDDELVDESSLAVIKEMIERLLKFLEDPSILDNLRLHQWGDLLVELEFLDHQVEIVKESLLNVSPDVVVKSWLNVIWFVRLLNLLDPHVERVKFFFDKSLKRVGCIKDTVDGPHQEGEECEADKLKGDREDVFLVGLSRVVTVTDCRDDFKDPIECEYILCVVGLKLKIISVDPGSYTILIPVGILVPNFIRIEFAIILASKLDPDAATQVRDVDDSHNQVAESDEIILSFLGFLLEDDPHDHVKWLHEHSNMNKAPKELEEVELVTLLENKPWHSPDKIEQEGAREWAHVVVGYWGELSEGSCLFDEAKKDLHYVNDINHSLNSDHCLLTFGGNGVDFFHFLFVYLL